MKRTKKLFIITTAYCSNKSHFLNQCKDPPPPSVFIERDPKWASQYIHGDGKTQRLPNQTKMFEPSDAGVFCKRFLTTSVVDTDSKFATGVVDTGGAT